MTRKDYEVIAKAIAEQVERNGGEVNDTLLSLTSLAGTLCREFAKENPRFDRDRFLTACKVDWA